MSNLRIVYAGPVGFLDEKILAYLLESGHSVLRPDRTANPEQAIEELAEAGPLDVYITGQGGVDEPILFQQNPAQFGARINAGLKEEFTWLRAITAVFMRQGHGSVIFPMLFDPNAADGYVTSPVRDHARLAMMKALAKELTPFRISVNAITFGNYARSTDRQQTKELKALVEIHHLKPALPDLAELVTSTSLLLQPPPNRLSGDLIHIGCGIEMVL